MKSLKILQKFSLYCLDLVDSFKFPQIPLKPKVIATKDKLQKFFDALDSELGEALFLFSASSGLGKSEVLGLFVSDVNFEKRMIVPNCHKGFTKNSYAGFCNREAEEALNRIDLKKPV